MGFKNPSFPLFLVAVFIIQQFVLYQLDLNLSLALSSDLFYFKTFCFV
jgi:hypothetical protein